MRKCPMAQLRLYSTPRRQHVTCLGVGVEVHFRNPNKMRPSKGYGILRRKPERFAAVKRRSGERVSALD
jgi:hypothetical protein